MKSAFALKSLSFALTVSLLVPPSQAHEPVYARKGMVVAQEPLAADVGASVLKSGGNAVDAAVAVGFALAVTYPYAGNLGGGGFMLIRMADGRTTFIDFREKASRKATHDMYLDASGNATKDSVLGWRAVGIPGTVRGLELALKKYGTKPWAELLQPAIHLAGSGFPISYPQMRSFKASADSLSQFPESKRIFLKGGALYDWNENFQQPELARTLEHIARHGAKDFYEGETARILAREVEKNGGLITLDDLREYQAVERKPLEGDYKGYHIITSPPPSSGGVGILQMLSMLDGTGYEKSKAGSATAYHYLAEAMRRYYADRNEYLGDPDFVKNPIAAMLDPAYIRARRDSIDPVNATPSDQIRPGLPAGAVEGSDTTHYSIADEQGNVVAVTYTLNNGYGSKVTVPGLGFLLNDEMDDFAAKPGTPNLYGLVQGEANSIAPGRRPLSSMVPTIALKDGKPFLVLGAPGGSFIITAVLQVMLNVMDFGMNVQDAIDFPRVHHQWKPDTLGAERGVSPDTIALLKKAGYSIEEAKPIVIARVEAILLSDGWLQGGHDERGSAGKAAGY
ncbi:MAG TPA: gamma-glutamyltransferase [Candidatus Acidoferrum sp.]|nr:gamma-glutamyltransferase [Candidatus Acidoferrum sp.]